MLSKILFGWLPSSIVLLGLAGCAEFDQRKGPAPIIDGTAVQTASSNKYWILNALAEDANVHDGNPDYYYLVTEAGFNYVDDQCRAYFDSLFFLERRRDELKSGLAASAATTAAILGVTQASAPSLAIVAAAFGLASSATDIVAGTYLYRLPPATTQGFVEKLQLAYRTGAADNHALITSPTSAYYQIQRYLNLCLPPAIEAEITRQVSSASAIFVPTGTGALFDVQSVGAPASALPRVGMAPVSFRGAGPASVGPSGPTTGPSGRTTGPSGRTTRPSHPIITGQTPLGPTVVPNVPGLPGFITSTEKQMRAEQLARIQRNVLCIVPENPTFDTPTREGIRIFQQTRGARDEAATGQIDEIWRDALLDRAKSGKPCPEDARNFFEWTKYFPGGKVQAGQVTQLQQLLNARSEGDQITKDEMGQLGPATRKKIAAVRRGMTNLGDPPSAEQQVTPLFFKELISK